MLLPLTFALLQTALPARFARSPRAADTSAVIKPGSEHGGGWLHKFFFGDAWRSLWTTPIRAPVANLDTLYGGLKATEKGGHAQTLSLRFTTPDGRGMQKVIAYMAPFIADKSKWPKPPDVEYFSDLPVRQPSLLFGGIAYSKPEWIALWKRLDAEPKVPEIIRNFPIRQPLLWV